MKKIILVLVLLLFSSCNRYITTNVYEKKYTDVNENIIHVDVYKYLKYYNVDSIPIENWIKNELIFDTTKIIQYTIKKTISKKSMYMFIFSKYDYPLNKYYTLLIRYSGLKKEYK